MQLLYSFAIPSNAVHTLSLCIYVILLLINASFYFFVFLCCLFFSPHLRRFSLLHFHPFSLFLSPHPPLSLARCFHKYSHKTQLNLLKEYKTAITQVIFNSALSRAIYIWPTVFQFRCSTHTLQ